MPTDYADYGAAIAEEFREYLRTGDESLIDKYSARELKAAISRLSPFYDANRHWFRAIEQRIDQLSKQEEFERQKSVEAAGKFLSHWKDRIIFFALGLIAGLFLF